MGNPVKNETTNFFDKHFTAILPITLVLVGAAVVGMQMRANKIQEKRSAQIETNAYILADKSYFDADVERETRWQFDMAKMLWKNREFLKVCDQTEMFMRLVPRDILPVVGEQMQYLRARCDSGRGASETVVPPTPKKIVIPATSFIRSQNVAASKYGPNIILNAPPYKFRPNAASYEFEATKGKYNLEVSYAAESERPVRISINGEIVNENGLAETTGGWSEKYVKSLPQGQVELRDGLNLLTLSRTNVFPHIETISFLPVE